MHKGDASMKRKYLIATICCFAISILAIYSCVSHPILKEIIVLLVSIIGAVAVFLQLHKTTSLTTGEFILSLQQTYSSNEAFVNLFLDCWNDLKSPKSQSTLEIDRATLINYLIFFESIYIMLEKQVLNIELIDDLFGRRFFVVVNNHKVQEELIQKENYKYYLNIYKLYFVWRKHRQKQECKQKQVNSLYKDELINVFNDKSTDLWNALTATIGEQKANQLLKN